MNTQTATTSTRGLFSRVALRARAARVEDHRCRNGLRCFLPGGTHKRNSGCRKGLKAVAVSWLRGSGRFAAALFIFFAAAAGAGIVAPDFRSGPHRLWSFGLGGPGLILQLLLLAALTAFDFASFFFGARWLNQEQIANGLAINAAHHLLEKSEGFLFELDERIFLAVTAH